MVWSVDALAAALPAVDFDDGPIVGSRNVREIASGSTLVVKGIVQGNWSVRFYP
jgi:hypothetical protein